MPTKTPFPRQAHLPTRVASPAPARGTAPLSRLRRRLHPFHLAKARGTEALNGAIHGVVLYLAVLGATYRADYSAAKILLVCVGSVVFFWITHVYAATLARHGTAQGPLDGLEFAWEEARRSSSIVQAVIAPTLALLLAIAGLLPTTVALVLSMWTGVASLAGLAYLALRIREAPRLRAALLGALTGGLGGAIITGSTLVH